MPGVNAVVEQDSGQSAATVPNFGTRPTSRNKSVNGLTPVPQDQPMPIAATCSSCKTTFRVKDEHAGKRGTCPRCQAPVEIPAAAPVPRSGPAPKQQVVMQEI